jgi:VWFA-related protein
MPRLIALAVSLAMSQAAIRSGVDLVSLSVTVTDSAQKFIPGLTQHDFVVTEDGVPQPLSFFASEPVPLDLAIVLDTSGSMGAEIRIVQDAACGLARTLRAGDRGAVVEVKNGAQVPQGLTEDVPAIEAAIRGTTPGGNTALYDGLYVVLRELASQRRSQREIRRQAIVVLSDGIDNASHLAFDDVLDLARHGGVAVYIISPPRVPVEVLSSADFQFVSRAQYSMNTLVREAGGRLFVALSTRDLQRVYGAIASELANQYELGYVPLRATGDGGFRRVSVQVVNHINALARTRTGYLASASTLARTRTR